MNQVLAFHNIIFMLLIYTIHDDKYFSEYLQITFSYYTDNIRDCNANMLHYYSYPAFLSFNLVN